MEREVGGGIGMGNTCKPMAVSFQCMTKFTTNKKKKECIKIPFLREAETIIKSWFADLGLSTSDSILGLLFLDLSFNNSSPA